MKVSRKRSIFAVKPQPMLYNHELVKKLRFSAYGLAAFFLVYAILTFRDGNLTAFRLIFLSATLSVSVIAAWLLRKASKPALYVYATSMLLSVILLLFRIHGNIALDITLLALSVGLPIAFWYQIRKKEVLADQ